MYATCKCRPHQKEPHRVKGAPYSTLDFHIPYKKAYRSIYPGGPKNIKMATYYVSLGFFSWAIGPELSCNGEEIPCKKFLCVPHFYFNWKWSNGDKRN